MINSTVLNICLTALMNNFNCPEMLALAELESSFRPAAIGKVGEQGLYQMRPEFFGKVPKDVQGQTKKAIITLKWIKTKCQKDATLQYILCWNVGTNKGRSMLKSKAGPYRLNYIKLAKKWELWYNTKYARNLLLTNLLRFDSTSAMAKKETLVFAP